MNAVDLQFDGFRGVLQSELCSESFSGLYSAEWKLFVSLKNPSFSRDYIREFCELVERFRSRGSICLVDTPYLQNIAVIDSAADRKREIEKYEAIRAEKERLVTRFDRFERVSLIEWEALFDETPKWLISELRKAFFQRGAVYEYLVKQTRDVFHYLKDTGKVERLAKFLLEEYPTLLYVYYVESERQIVDVYPGENAEFFWALERGEFEVEMPRVTKVARNSRGILYMKVS